MRKSVLALVLTWSAILATGVPICVQSQDAVPRRLATPLDSVGRASKAAAMKEAASLRRSSPASFDSLRAMIAFSRQMSLARLGYIAGPFDIALTPALSAAIRSYERDRGLEETGDPLSFELGRSLEDDEMFFVQAPLLPTKGVAGDSEFVLVRGAWTFPEMGEQYIAVELRCDRRAGTCVESQAILSSGGFFGSSLSTNQELWTIARWDAVEIATEPVDFTCARYVLRINLVQKSATKVRSTISNAAQCSHQTREDLVISLRDGADLAAEQARRRASEPFPARLTPRASDRLNAGVVRPAP